MRVVTNSRVNALIVNASGNGDYTKIQWAIDNASEGDTVIVEPDTYFESVIMDKGISLIGAGNDITIIDGTGFDIGIKVMANWSNVSGFKIINCNDDAIKLEKVSNCNIKNNTCTSNVGAIGIRYSNNISISNNICSSNKGGIGLDYSTDNFVQNNTCNSNEFGGMCLFRSSRNTIYNNIVNFNRWAIDLDESNNNNIDYNICNNSFDSSGIRLTYSSNNIISNNTCNFNPRHGIYNYFGDGNNVTNNRVSMNFWCGVYLTGNYNIITNNICDSNSLGGIVLRNGTNNNQITNNTLYSNTLNGIEIGYWPSNNNIHHNNFLFNNNNGTQASDDGTNNNWDDGNEGNFWSNWITPDTNENGIVDLPYNLNGITNAQDHFPLVNPISKLLIIANAGNDVTIDKNQTVIFDGSESWGYPSITNYTWTFNYNSSPIFLYGISPHFTFEIPSTYIITLTVGNESGNSDTDQMIVYVRDAEPPIDVEPPFGDAGSDKTIRRGETFIFNGNKSSDNVGIINYTWNFTYNNTNTVLYGMSPSFKFDIPGTYNVSLNVTDARGNWATDVMVLTVRDSDEPIARAGEDVIIDQHETMHFDASASYDDFWISNYTWNFVYGQNEIHLYGVMPDFAFDEVGMFPVTLTVTDADGHRDTDTLLVTVRDITPPIVDAGSDIVIDQHQTVRLNASNSSDNVGIVDYTWSFTYDENPLTLYDKTTAFIFHKAGFYIIILNITDAEGNRATDTINVTVHDITSPIADAGSNISIRKGETAFFDGNGSSDNVGIANYSWSFSYKSTFIELRGENTSLVFDIPGIYIVTLTVSDFEGNTAEDNLSLTILGEDDDDDTTPNNDTDDDGMPDWWEEKYGLDTNDSWDANVDGDNDGLTNLEEYRLTFVYGNSTDPTRGDTDGDGYDDGYEVEKGTNPLDAGDHPGRVEEEINVLVIIIIVGAVVVVLLAGTLRYSRIRTKKERLLDNENRVSILACINGHQGIHLRAIKKELGLAMGNLWKHIRILQKENLIESESRGNFKFFYPIGQKGIPRPLTPIQKKIVDNISRKPGSTNRSLAENLGKSERSISYHTRNLADIGVVRSERDGENELHWFADEDDDPVSREL